MFYSLQKYMADILSILALTMAAEGERVSLPLLEIVNVFLVIALIVFKLSGAPLLRVRQSFS